MENFASAMNRVATITIERADGFRFVWHGGEYADVSHRERPDAGTVDVLNWWDPAAGCSSVDTVEKLYAEVSGYEFAGSGKLVDCVNCDASVDLLSSVLDDGIYWCGDACYSEWTSCDWCGVQVHSDMVANVGGDSWACVDCAPALISEAVGAEVEFWGLVGGWTFSVEGFGRGHLVVGGIPDIESVRELMASS